MKKKGEYNIYAWLAILILIAVGTIVFEIKNAAAYKVEPRAEEVANYKVKDNTNKETVGWLRVQGTNIDFPVLYAPGYDFQYEPGKFTWTEAKFDELNNIVFISGHNIKNMSKHPLIADPSHDRFEQLMSFAYYDFAKENQFIQYTFNGVDYLYRIYSVAFYDAVDVDMYNSIEYTRDDLRDHVNSTLRDSLYKYDISVNENDKFLSLNTCTAMFGDEDDIRITVNARLVREDEKIKLAKIEETAAYKEVEKIMEGGDSDEEADEV